MALGEAEPGVSCLLVSPQGVQGLAVNRCSITTCEHMNSREESTVEPILRID